MRDEPLCVDCVSLDNETIAMIFANLPVAIPQERLILNTHNDGGKMIAQYAVLEVEITKLDADEEIMEGLKNCIMECAVAYLEDIDYDTIGVDLVEIKGEE
jgi:hypothetical protein